MELIITKNGHIYARARDSAATTNDIYELKSVADADIPAYPTEDAGKGKYYELDYTDGVLTWVTKDRPLTTEERVEQIAEEVYIIKYPWKAGEAVKAGDRRYYAGAWYVCRQEHTTQADWTPDAVPALWQKE